MTKRKVNLPDFGVAVVGSPFAADTPGGVDVTKVAPALARGAEDSPGCRKALRDLKAPKSEPEVKAATAAKAIKRAAAPKAAKAVKATTGAKLALKQNKEVRGLLSAACAAAGGTRLQPIGFESYTAFLAGVPLDAEGNATVAFIPVKGPAPVAGKNVKLTIKGGKVTSVK